MTLHASKTLLGTLLLAGAFGCQITTAGAQSMAPGTASTPMSAASGGKGQMSGMGHGSDEMKKSMESGMQDMQRMKMTGDIDKDFAMMMKMHHEQALPMAKVELDHGKSPELKAMATKIINAQKKEIAQFEKWLKNHE